MNIVRVAGKGLLLLVSIAAMTVQAEPLPIFDAHIHYSDDAWSAVSPEQAVQRLRNAGVMRALVSSSNDDGTQKLHAAAPDLVIPSLRPYRQRRDQWRWLRDPAVVTHVEQRLKQHRYVAIGELHVQGAEADAPNMRRMVELAKQYGLMLHVHSDAEAIGRIFRQDPQARILWAHAGFEEPPRVGELLSQHRQLWADLSFRFDVESGGQLVPAWRALLLQHPDRFMVGTDTFSPERWDKVAQHAQWVRGWLADLPSAVAERIAYRNGEALVTAAYRKAAPAVAP